MAIVPLCRSVLVTTGMGSGVMTARWPLMMFILSGFDRRLALVQPSGFGRRLALVQPSSFDDRLTSIRPLGFGDCLTPIRPSGFGDRLMLIRPFGFGSAKVIGFPHQLPPEFFCRGILGRRIHQLWSSFGRSERTWLSRFRCEE